MKAECSRSLRVQCVCWKVYEYPLEGECLVKEIIYQAKVKCEGKEEAYVGLTATDFKARLANHKASFKTKSKSSATDLSKHVWQLKEKNLNYSAVSHFRISVGCWEDRWNKETCSGNLRYNKGEHRKLIVIVMIIIIILTLKRPNLIKTLLSMV